MAPASKRRKTTQDQQRFLCYGCDVERVPSQFPDCNPSADCQHLINTCTTCLKKWVEAQVEAGSFKTDRQDSKVFGIACPHPGCQGTMTADDVEGAATRKVFGRFDEIARRHVAEHTPGWRWCLAPQCKAGQIHDSSDAVAVTTTAAAAVDDAAAPEHISKSKRGSSKSKKKAIGDEITTKTVKEVETKPDIIDIFQCDACGARACVPCDRPYHDGESCAQYQRRVKDRLEEEDQTLQTIQKSTRKCPACGVNIQKNGGCPYMICHKCKTSFCWTCMQNIDSAGRCDCKERRYP
ncbi:hypothetical protein KC318_g11128 [Hortaea werneckii]|uniref:RBR-type E3 ubiquitin transferase n=1 Tax=Hortaea werneckii TaxID=91943 RepID=A0A3M6XMQ1_HORWE|nr:hypothetical protein KC334_g10722 [Hortaea werneckii]KAI6978866.1 hypothetical protein KC355_g11165 [Hortaea werneckii]KAI7658613.1 hypothetical protein KC318_g11128 [Hortaea werneckii]RMX91876.1 hypothetical protein D0867_14797 [Hortaea werneckii]RMY07226.1 hypothetical protein D0866_14939 [Hortaea werneckii]